MSLQHRTSKNRGFTLVETVVYIALFILLSVVVIDALFMTAKVLRQARTTRAVTSAGEAAMERMIRDIRFGSGVTTLTAGHPGMLEITGYDPETLAEQQVRFAWAATSAGGKIQVTEGAAAAEDLTPPSLNVSNLVFRQITLVTGTYAIKIEMTVNGVNFYGTALMRRAYQ
jgi:type II secretory pathway pseudopilin PulG